jgi:hypothetical protein
MLGERQIEQPRAVGQPLASDDAHDAVVRVEPHGRNIAVAGVGADHGDLSTVQARDVAHVVPDTPRPPIRQQVGSAAFHRDQDVRERARGLCDGGLGDLAVGPTHPDAVADRELDLPLTLDRLLDALALWKLEQHALFTSRDPALPVGVVQGETLVDHEVSDLDVGEAGDEGFHRGPCILGHRLRGTRADRGEDERQDEGVPHGCGYNAVDTRTQTKGAFVGGRRAQWRHPGLVWNAGPTRCRSLPWPFHRELGAMWRKRGSFEGFGGRRSSSSGSSAMRAAVDRAQRRPQAGRSPLARSISLPIRKWRGSPRFWTRCSTIRRRVSGDRSRPNRAPSSVGPRGRVLEHYLPFQATTASATPIGSSARSGVSWRPSTDRRLGWPAVVPASPRHWSDRGRSRCRDPGRHRHTTLSIAA